MTNDDNPFRPLAGNRRKKSKPERSANTWMVLDVIPSTAEAKPKRHPKHGLPSHVYEYRHANNELAGYVYRFEDSDCSKQFSPLTYCQSSTTGQSAWRWKAWTAPRPLYGLRQLANRPDAKVIVTEGEKAADAARILLPDVVVVTSPNGSKAAGKADWSALAGRDVTIWPDNDGAGQQYASDIISILQVSTNPPKSVAVVAPDPGYAAGWDAADALMEGWREQRATDLVNAATLIDRTGEPDNSTAAQESTGHQSRERDKCGRRRLDHRRQVIGLLDTCELWLDQDARAHATVPISEHRENMRLDSTEFGTWLSGECYRQWQEPIGEQLLRDAIRVLVAKATYNGRRYQTFLRVGGYEGRLYLDLGRQDWSLVAIGPDGWELAYDAPIKAVRRPNMQPLPIPERGSSLDATLRPLVNVRSERDYRLIVAWLLCALRDTGEYPILSISGEHGSAKSTTTRMIRRLIDPDKATNRAAPQNERDLVVAAHNARVISLDNLSGLSPWLSDALCRISTGGGFSTRALHTNMDEVVEHLENPIILNGIPEIAGRPDLTDRSYTIHLPAITEQDRRTASDFWAEFESNQAVMLGALLDAASSALRNLPHVRLPSKPRMANAAEWVTAAEAAFGWEAGTHISDLQSNRRDANEASLDCEPVAIAIVELDLPWTGTPTQLHKKLSEIVSGIPKTVNGFGAALMRIQPVLLQFGIAIEKKRGKERSITIKRIH